MATRGKDLKEQYFFGYDPYQKDLTTMFSAIGRAGSKNPIGSISESFNEAYTGVEEKEEEGTIDCYCNGKTTTIPKGQQCPPCNEDDGVGDPIKQEQLFGEGNLMAFNNDQINTSEFEEISSPLTKRVTRRIYAKRRKRKK